MRDKKQESENENERKRKYIIDHVQQKTKKKQIKRTKKIRR